MPFLQQLLNREFLASQRSHLYAQSDHFRSMSEDIRSSIGDLSIVAPATFATAAIILQDAASQAANMAREAGGDKLADRQLRVFNSAISRMIKAIVAEGGDIKFDKNDPLYEPAVMKIFEKLGKRGGPKRLAVKSAGRKAQKKKKK
jgi:hypothetical protein